MGSETQREAAATEAALLAQQWAQCGPNAMSELLHFWQLGWDARSAALPDREQIAEVLRPYTLSYLAGEAADAVLSLLSGKES